jgi:hypothetical protein
MFDKNDKFVEVGNTVTVLSFFHGIIEKIDFDGLENIAVINWEMKSGMKLGRFFSEEFQV